MSSDNTPQRMSRGGSCSNCRHRRIKCDGALPRCSNCERSTGRFRDCEYPGRGGSQIEDLERQIEELESRIQEQERSIAAERTGNSVLLHNPYASYDASTTAQAQSVWAPFRMPSAQRSEDVPLQLRQTLLVTFLPYALEFGFFLDTADVCNSIMSVSSHSSTGTMPVAPALMYSIFLLASHLSTSSPQVSALEPEFLSRAVGSVSQILTPTSRRTETRTSDHPHWKVLQAIQSHVLLAQYFFLTGRKLEGRYSVTIAVSLVLGTRMHRIRSEEEVLQSFGMHRETGRGVHTGGYTSGSSAQSVNPLEETERINAFWTVLALNSRWTAIEGNGTSSLPYWTAGMRIDTPWPWINLDPTARSSSTIQRFLANTPDDGHSILALHAKACIILEQAFDLANRYDQNQPSSATGSSQSAQNFLGAFNSLIGLATRLTSELPPIDSVPDSPPSATSSFPRASNSGSKKRQLLVIHTLVRVAAIRLYSLFENTNYSGPNERVRAHQLKLEAANEAARMIGLIDGRGVVFIDSVMAMLWPVIAHVLITEIRRLGGRGHTQVEYQGSFDLISRAMSGLAPCSTLMSEQLGKMQGSRSM